MISRTSSTPVCEAASISMTSTCRSAAIAVQASQTPQGSSAGSSRVTVGAEAVERAGEDARRGRLADAAHARQHEGMRDPAGPDRIGEDAHQRFLADEVGEGGGPVFAGQHPVGGDGLAHCRQSSPDFSAGSWSARRCRAGRVGEPCSAMRGIGQAARRTMPARQRRPPGRAQASARGGANAAIHTNCRVVRGVADLDRSPATLFGPLIADRTPGQRRRP